MRRRKRSRPWHSVAELSLVARMAMRVGIWPALMSLGDIARGKRVRGWNGLNKLAARDSAYYPNWIACAERRLTAVPGGSPTDADVVDVLCLVLSGPGQSEAAAKTVGNLRAVLGERADILTLGTSAPGTTRLDDGAVLADIFAAAGRCGNNARWFLPVRAGDTISESLPALLASAMRRAPDADVVFWDIDVIEDGARCRPWLRGAWDPWTYLSRDTLGGASVLSLGAMRELEPRFGQAALDAGMIAALQMVLASSRNGAVPVHAAGIGSHWSTDTGPVSPGQWPGIVADHWPDAVEYNGEAQGNFLAVVPSAPKSWPSVSIIIPTKDQPGHLGACVAGLDLLTYPGRVQRVLVDNGTTDPQAVAILAGQAQRADTIVVRDDGPFNFSALNNHATRISDGEYLCLLNNDVEAVDGDWLETLIRFAVLPEVGAVGPLLTYPDGTIQHAGVVIGIGDAAGHICRFASPADPSNGAWHHATRTTSAVTAACLVVSRKDFDAVGGLDEDAFAVAFNDIDFCLKLRARHLVNVFTPVARLIHHESVSRGDDMKPANRARFEGELYRFQQRWSSAGYEDPFYSPLFSRSSEQCLLRF